MCLCNKIKIDFKTSKQPSMQTHPTGLVNLRDLIWIIGSDLIWIIGGVIYIQMDLPADPVPVHDCDSLLLRDRVVKGRA